MIHTLLATLFVMFAEPGMLVEVQRLPPLPQPPAELPAEWGCEIVMAGYIAGEPCQPSIVFDYCEALHRTIATHMAPTTIGEDTVCLPERRADVPMNP